MRSIVILFLVSFIIWALLSWPMDTEHLAAGLMVCALVALFTSKLFPRRLKRVAGAKGYFWFFYLLGLSAVQCLKSNIDIALIIFKPRLSLEPSIIKYKTALRSDTAVALLSNSITLMPHLLCVDADPEEGVLHLHYLGARPLDKEKIFHRIGKIESVLKRIFE